MTPISLCMITKYPPIQGGVSQQNYWLAHNLARAGHRVHVVTNALEAGADYRMFVPRAEWARLEAEYPGGGHVRLHPTSETGLVGNYIPYANPFVSKLAAVARDVVHAHGCEMIWSAYLEPYGVAALLTSQITGVPYAVRHAGSDIAGLAQLPSRQNFYLDVLRKADLVVTTRFLHATFGQAGIAADRMYSVPLRAYASDGFSPDGPALAVDAVLDEACADPELAPRRRPARRFDPALPTFGVYGKVSAYKGMFELVEALGRLAAAGRRFNLLTLTGTRGPGVAELDAAIVRAGLGECTYSLPFLPHWMVPRFVRSCTAVCFLENRFPIAIHTPQVGFEIMACGRCLIVSEEVWAKTHRRSELVDGVDALVVADPRDVGALTGVLARVLDEPALARQIGARAPAFVAERFPAPEVGPVGERLRRTIEEANAMSLEGLQRTLSDLYADPAMRAALAAGVDASLHGRELDEHERAAVLQTAVRLMPQVDRFGRMLVRKRLDYYLELFATTAAHLHAHDAALLRWFGEVHDFRWREPLADVAYFADLLRRFLATTDTVPAYVHDLLRYDEQMWRAETGADVRARPFARLREMTSEEPPALGAGLTAADRIALAPGVVLERFAYPVHRIGTQPADEVRPEPTIVAFTPRQGALAARAHVVGAELLRMLADIGDGREVRDLLAAAVARHPAHPPAAVRQAAMLALQQLGERHLVVRVDGS